MSNFHGVRNISWILLICPYAHQTEDPFSSICYYLGFDTHAVIFNKSFLPLYNTHRYGDSVL